MNLILDLLFPKKCVGCGTSGTYFCQECLSNIKQSDLVCPKCEKLAVGGQTHPVCRRRFGLDGLWSLGIYQDQLRSAIQELKYKGVKELAQILVDVTIEYWARYDPFVLDEIKKDQGQKWIVIPVPMYWLRANSRGFNQSSLIGKILADKLGLTYLDVLKRIRYTKPQVKLKRWDRQKNIRNAFAINPYCNLSPVTCVLLIDDVWTTGSTLKECAFVLKRNGAKKVWALTLAR